MPEIKPAEIKQTNNQENKFDPFAIMKSEGDSQPNQPQPDQNLLMMLKLFSQVKKHITAAPTHIPRNFFESIEFYDDTTNFRAYLYINGTWRYVALT